MALLQSEALEEQINTLMDESSESEMEDATPEAVSYEQLREKTIKENREKMQKLGLFNLSLKIKSVKPIRKNNFSAHKISPSSSPSPSLLQSTEPRRRSSRLQSASPVSYCELKVPKEKNLRKDIALMRKEGSKPEIYTEEHDKLLGDTQKVWTLFVDGCGDDGKRIYDSVKGKTCHQCRQKTLGHRTHCSNCEMVQGQFCGDCLYMRYGENVLEANENPDWTCPVCRGICNCSLCRQARGWAPTGSLYRKISQLGFKSVAHYLIQTYRSQTGNEAPGIDDLAIVPFESTIETCQGQSEDKDNVIKTKEEEDGDVEIIEDVSKTDAIIPFESTIEIIPGQFEDEDTMIKTKHKDASKTEAVIPSESTTGTHQGQTESKVNMIEIGLQSSPSEEDGDVEIIECVSKTDDTATNKKAKKKRTTLDMDSIGSRLKLRRRGCNAFK